MLSRSGITVLLPMIPRTVVHVDYYISAEPFSGYRSSLLHHLRHSKPLTDCLYSQHNRLFSMRPILLLLLLLLLLLFIIIIMKIVQKVYNKK